MNPRACSFAKWPLARLFCLGWLAFALTRPTADAAEQELIVPPCFGDNMVLQGPPFETARPLLWGWVDQRLDVFIRIGTVGEFKAEKSLRPAPRHGQLCEWTLLCGIGDRTLMMPEGPFNVVISTGTKSRRTGPDILFTNVCMGDVWLLVSDPRDGLSPQPIDFYVPGLKPLRVLPLATGDWSHVDPAAADRLIQAPWQSFNASLTKLPSWSATAAYWLENFRATRLDRPVGILLVSQADLGYFLPHQDLPETMRQNRTYKRPLDAATAAWARASRELDEARSQFQRDMILRKRRGEIVSSPPPPDVPVGTPSLYVGEIQQLRYTVRGAVH